MSRKARLPQSRHHVMLYDEDWKFLSEQYGPGTDGSALGISGAVREIIHQRVQGMKAKINAALDRLPQPEEGK